MHSTPLPERAVSLSADTPDRDPLPPHEVTELLQASATPAHGSAQHATAVTAAAVAMPSAEQLVAAAGGNAAAQSQASVAGESAQHTQVVGKVLADALHGGEAHGPNLDALLQAAHGQTPAHDAIEQVMTQQAPRG